MAFLNCFCEQVQFLKRENSRHSSRSEREWCWRGFLFWVLLLLFFFFTRREVAFSCKLAAISVYLSPAERWKALLRMCIVFCPDWIKSGFDSLTLCVCFVNHNRSYLNLSCVLWLKKERKRGSKFEFRVLYGPEAFIAERSSVLWTNKKRGSLFNLSCFVNQQFP